MAYANVYRGDTLSKDKEVNAALAAALYRFGRDAVVKQFFQPQGVFDTQVIFHTISEGCGPTDVVIVVYVTWQETAKLPECSKARIHRLTRLVQEELEKPDLGAELRVKICLSDDLIYESRVIIAGREFPSFR